MKILILFMASSLTVLAQLDHTLNAQEQAAISSKLDEIKTELVNAAEPALTNLILENLAETPPASLQVELPLAEGQTKAEAIDSFLADSKIPLFQRLKQTGGTLFQNLDERVWMASQYVNLIALTTDTELKGENLPLLLNRNNEFVSRADALQYAILREISELAEKHEIEINDEQKENWLNSAGSSNVFCRLSVLAIASSVINDDSFYQELISSYEDESSPRVLDVVLEKIANINDRAAVEQIAESFLLNSENLSPEQTEALMMLTKE